MKLNIVYFGSPNFSAQVLEKLILDKDLQEKIIISSIITQPDKPVGRKKILTNSPVKDIGLKYSIPIEYNPKSLLKSVNSNKYKAPDLAIVFAYGLIIPANILKIPKLGFWNIHPSLLPKYRGASPISYPLALGDKETGVTLMEMDEKMDHGPIIKQVKTTIESHETRKDLEIRLSDIGFEILKEQVLELIKSENNINTKEQIHSQSTYTRLLNKDDGFIPWKTINKSLKNEPLNYEDFPLFIKEYVQKNNIKNILKNNSPTLIYNLFRALYPWPGLWTKVKINDKERRMKITDVKLESRDLIINKVQVEGKEEIDFKLIDRYIS